jgi:hypothetical protein
MPAATDVPHTCHACSAFTSIYNAQQYLDTNSSSTKNTAVVPGRRLLLLHALELLRQHPNMTFSEHPASVVKEVCSCVCSF